MSDLAIQIGVSLVLQAPLKKITSSSASCTSKLVAALAIVIFTVFSLGYYVVYAYQFFQQRRVEDLQLRLEHIVDPAEVDKIFGQNPGLIETINTTTPYGISSYLQIAVSESRFDVAEKFFTYGADTNKFGRCGTALGLSVIKGNVAAVKWCLAHLANVDLGEEDIPPVMLVFSRMEKRANQCDILKLLLENRASPNIKEEGFSPLGYAAVGWKGDQEKAKALIQLLLKHGGRLNGDDSELHIDPEALQFIEQASAPER